jgi:acetyl esterase
MHPQAQDFLAAMAEAGTPPLHELTVEDARGGAGALIELIGPGPEIAHVAEIEIPVTAGSIAARVYQPSADPAGTIAYYHGGGWVLGSLDVCDAVCRALALESGCRLVSVDYRLAPEHPFPTAPDDSYDALLWIAENLAGGSPLVVAGDSAGGNLAAVVALRARDEDGPPIALQVLIYPVVDHDMTTDSYEQYAEEQLFLNRLGMTWFWDHYLPVVAERSHPHASPLRAADHSGLPPAYVLVVEYDPLRDEGLAYAEKLEAAGVPVTLRRFDDQIHGFFMFVNLMESADAAVAEAGAAIHAACLARGPAAPLDATSAGS